MTTRDVVLTLALLMLIGGCSSSDGGDGGQSGDDVVDDPSAPGELNDPDEPNGVFEDGGTGDDGVIDAGSEDDASGVPVDEPAGDDDPEPGTSNPDPVGPIVPDPEPSEPEPVVSVPTEPEPVTPEPIQPDPVSPEPADPEPMDPEPADPEPTDPEPVDPEPTDPEPADPEPVDPEPTDPESTDPEPVDPEPTPSGSTRIDFEITVPPYPYMYDTLRVEVERGSRTLDAEWIGDEYWTASGIFLADFERESVVRFYDGAVLLGIARTTFRTGTNASESFRVTADDFVTEELDEDGDGVSNLAESIAGTDPFLDQTNEQEIRGEYDVDRVDWVISRVSGFYESELPPERPYVEQRDEATLADQGGRVIDKKKIVTIDIEESGTGSYYDYDFTDDSGDRTIEEKVATRTNTGDGVMWQGTYERYNSGADVLDEIAFTTVTRVIDEQTREQTGTVERSTRAGPDVGVILSYTLTGEVIDDSPWCEPVAGSIVHDGEELYRSSPDLTETTISKEVDDVYWTVVTAETATGRVLEEYLVPSLNLSLHCAFGTSDR